jgi:hypothetical protein
VMGVVAWWAPDARAWFMPWTERGASREPAQSDFWRTERSSAKEGSGKRIGPSLGQGCEGIRTVLSVDSPCLTIVRRTGAMMRDG